MGTTNIYFIVVGTPPIPPHYLPYLQNDKILDAFSGVFNNMNNIITSVVELDKERHNMRVLVARYTLGYQIEYCLRNTDSCNIYCEY